MKINCFNRASVLLNLIVFASLLVAPKMASGQCSPAAPTSCNLSGTYTCTNIAEGQSKTVQQLIDEGILLPTATAQTTPQRVVVDGRVEFNIMYHFHSGSELIFTENDSEFFITSPKGLVMRATHVHGCEKLWNRIAVQGGRLDIEDCIIEDGFAAIRLLENSRIRAVNNVFKGNLFSIRAGDGLSPTPVDVDPSGEGIIENEFYGDEQLVENVGLYTYPLFGLFIENVVQFRLGTGGVYDPNIISDFTHAPTPQVPAGINSQNSNLIIRNTAFYNIGTIATDGSELRGIGLYANSTDGALLLDFEGIGPGNSTFGNVAHCIQFFNINASIRHTNFLGFLKGIYALGGDVPCEANFTNNDFTSFVEEGIRMEDLFPSKDVNINFNKFSDNSSLVYDSRRIAINVVETANSNVTSENLSIGYNIFDRSTNSIHASIGTSNLDGGLILENTFTNFSSGDYQGIRISSTDNINVLSNTIIGNGSATSTGFHNAVSGFNFYNCNTMDNLGTGIFFNPFDGMADDGTNLLNNYFGRLRTGLSVGYGTLIGEQEDKENQWPLSISISEASFLTDPLDPDYGFYLGNSLFKINSPETAGSIYWAQPRIPAGSDWFDFSGGFPPSENICLLPYTGGLAPITKIEKMLYQGTFPTLANYSSAAWDASIRFYKRLHAYPELRPLGSGAAYYYTQQYSSNTGKLARITAALGRLGKPTTTMDTQLGTYYDQLEGLAEQMEALDVLLAHAQTEAEIDSIEQNQAELNGLIKVVRQNIATASQQHKLNVQNEAQALMADLDGVSAILSQEQTLKTVLVVLLNAQLANADLSPAQKATLQSVANQCRYTEGVGVVMARSVLGILEEYGENEFCQGSRTAQSGDMKNQIPSMTVWPNPAVETLTIQVPKSNGKSTLVLRDMMSREVLRQSLENVEGEFSIDISKCHSGFYIVEFWQNGTLGAFSKVSINR